MRNYGQEAYAFLEKLSFRRTSGSEAEEKAAALIAQRIRELIRYELLAAMPESEIAKGAVDVDHLIESAKELGYKDANILDYSLLHLN